MHGCRLIALLLILALVGCSSDLPESDPPVEVSTPPKAGSDFDPGRCGTVRGQVKWDGDQLQLPEMPIRPLLNDPKNLPHHRPNPNLPRVDATTNGIADAVVYLRGVDPRRMAAWPHEPVRVIMNDFQIQVQQGSRSSKVGVAHRDEIVEMVSKQPALHTLRAGGAAFFTLPFPDPHSPSRRRLTEPGVVEWTSGAGYFWMRAHLFVADHPYYAVTDEQGQFTLPNVPDGDYELVCWMPNWNVTRHDRDPESGRVSRLTFAAPLELVQSVHVEAGAITPMNFRVGAEAFALH